ncbi:hypothetical protein L2E82_51391 [Cichorium intybus]|nr:hypothetical protein L2E82_51391 [Cichorium intybus]
MPRLIGAGGEGEIPKHSTVDLSEAIITSASEFIRIELESLPLESSESIDLVSDPHDPISGKPYITSGESLQIT